MLPFLQKPDSQYMQKHDKINKNIELIRGLSAALLAIRQPSK
jgi:hypothetical protein